MRSKIEKAVSVTDFETNVEHQEITSEIIERFQKNQTDRLSELMVEAVQIRKFLS